MSLPPLPQELGGSVKAGLDKQLGPAVAAALGGKPLQEAFRTSFSKQVVPAFEGATQVMFQQINTAFSAGLEEHLQVGRGGWGRVGATILFACMQREWPRCLVWCASDSWRGCCPPPHARAAGLAVSSV